MRLLLIIFLFSVHPLSQAKPLEVFVSVLPLKTFVKKIGGDFVNVHSMVQQGFDPHHFNPTPQQIRKLSKGDLYVQTGITFEDVWVQRFKSVNPSMHFLDSREGLALRHIEGHDHGAHEHDTKSLDPHVWTNPRMVKQILMIIRDKLSELDAGHAAEFNRNYEIYSQQVDQLDAELDAIFLSIRQRKFMVFHPAWSYFAERYKLEQVPIEFQGKEPGARSLVKLIKQAKADNIRIVFVQPQFDNKQAQQVAAAINGVVVKIDPLAEEYIANMQIVANQIAQGLIP